ncbi:MAG TPA: hypothetical protein VGN57_15370 [Pirellulaceae bacterium]|nr:hypothetical protein [Pirellulaceae bacterium]
MTEAVAKILTSIEALSLEERREAALEILRRSDLVSDEPLTDEQIDALAAERFRDLDEEEANGAEAG